VSDPKKLHPLAAAGREDLLPAGREIRGVHRSFRIGEKTLVMGVVNVTPDSFSDGGRFDRPEKAIAHALELDTQGADLLDLGAESTRPGATEVPEETEWARLGPVLEGLREKTRLPISVDTRHAEVARRALGAGADVVNDVAGLRDPAMREVVAELRSPVIVMHMRGTPATMQRNLVYGDLVGEVYADLSKATETARKAGIDSERILIDPGLGFGKSPSQSLELLARLASFRTLGYPIVVGASRKSFLGAIAGGREVDRRLEAGLAAAVLAADQGAAIVRTHDVEPTVRALAVADAVRRARNDSSGDPAK
jgi:dihydropteroate synthase